MRRFVMGWKMLGLEQSLGSRIVTYADDLVILCRRGKAEEALQQLRKIMSKLKLTVNEEYFYASWAPVSRNRRSSTLHVILRDLNRRRPCTLTSQSAENTAQKSGSSERKPRLGTVKANIRCEDGTPSSR